MSFTDGVKNFPRLPNGGGNLTGFLPTGTDSSLALRMTFNILCHYDALPYPVIQSGGKNAV